MAYKKKTWVSGETITKDSLNNIENGILGVENEIDSRLDGLNHILISMADYEALSESKKNDPTVLYMITDAPSIDLSAIEVNTEHLLPIKTFNDVLTTLATKKDLEDALDDTIIGDDLDNKLNEKLDDRLDGIKIEVVTNAEFEALPETEQNRDDILYIITNSDNENPSPLLPADALSKEEFNNDILPGLVTESEIDTRLDGLNIKALTEAEFESLSESEQNREDVLYIIDDSESIEADYDMSAFSIKNYLKDNLKLTITESSIDLILEDEIISSINKDDIINS